MIPASSTTINENVRIRRERRLPQAGEITVAIGQQVTPVQVVARASQQRGFTIVSGSELLGVRPEDIGDYLLVDEGAAVQRKKPLLEKRSLFGTKTITSPVNGVLYLISQGRLILQQTPELYELRAMMPGVVSNFLSNRGVVIETRGALLEGQWASGREGYGQLKVLGTRDTLLSSEHINADIRGAILVAGRVKSARALELAEENSARGIILGSAPASMVPDLVALRFPVLLTEGFGDIPMSTPAYNLLQQCDGREATLLGASTVDWRKPEVIVPIPESEPLEQITVTPERLNTGQLVRIWREPNTGKVGKVVALVNRPRVSDAGDRLPGAQVKLEDGNTVFVPYANLDMIR